MRSTDGSNLPGCDIRAVQELPGRKSPKTTMIYSHVLDRRGKRVHGPIVPP